MHTHEAGFILTDRIIGLVVTMHPAFGPGLFEAVYHHCLGREFQHDDTSFRDGGGGLCLMRGQRG